MLQHVVGINTIKGIIRKGKFVLIKIHHYIYTWKCGYIHANSTWYLVHPAPNMKGCLLWQLLLVVSRKIVR